MRLQTGIAELAFHPLADAEDYRFSYEVLRQRQRSAIIDAAFQLPSFEEHVANVRTRFASYHVITFRGERLGVVYFKQDYEIGLHFLLRQIVRMSRQIRAAGIRDLGTFVCVEYVRLIQPERWRGKAYHRNTLAVEMDRRVAESDYVATHYTLQCYERDGYVCYELERKR